MSVMSRPLRLVTYHFAWLLMAAGQLVFASAGLGDGLRGPSAPSHVERAGIDRHYAHDEATCPSCMLLSLHASSAPRRNVLPPERSRTVAAPAQAPVAVPQATRAPTYSSRAPPVVG